MISNVFSISSFFFFFFNDTATTEIYTLSLHDALPIRDSALLIAEPRPEFRAGIELISVDVRSEEHTSELQSQSNLVCRLLLEKKKKKKKLEYYVQKKKNILRQGI